MHQTKEQRVKGRGAPRALEVLNLGLATDCNTSGYKLLIEETRKILISNQVTFDATFFPRSNLQIIDDHMSNITEIDVLSLDLGDMKWMNYDPLVNLNYFKKVHSGRVREIIRFLHPPINK
jgi:hypothetical protein